jgi:hypothetical protein
MAEEFKAKAGRKRIRIEEGSLFTIEVLWRFAKIDDGMSRHAFLKKLASACFSDMGKDKRHLGISESAFAVRLNRKLQAANFSEHELADWFTKHGYDPSRYTV